MTESILTLAILGTLFLALLAIGIHQAINRLLNIVDGHLERLQSKLDVLLAAQTEHNEKIDVILRHLL